MKYQAATRPTLYFIGVTTGRSSIMKVFPGWARFLALGDCEIKGMDFPLGADPGEYRKAVTFIKNDPLSLGALVTTHKIDLLSACKDLFDTLDTNAQLLEEVSCISKQNGKLVGHAKDAETSVLALDSFLEPGYWDKQPMWLVCLGAGGANLALTTQLLQRKQNYPDRIVITDISQDKITKIREIHERLGHTKLVEYHVVDDVQANDQRVTAAPPGSVVTNGTGMGKDTPGSPVSPRVIFPEKGFAWEYNYRGALDFLQLAKKQAQTRSLSVVDGWAYFIHGWTRVIAEVFHVDIPTPGPKFEELSSIASKYR